MSRRVALFVGAAVVALLLVLARPAAAAVTDVDGCRRQCGNISIPYPFGDEPSCHAPGLKVTCRNDSSSSGGHHGGSPKLFLGDGTVEVLEISIRNNTVRINANFAYFPGSSGSDELGSNPITNDTWSGALREGGLYRLNLLMNRMYVDGCNVLVSAVDYSNTTVASCSALCNWDEEGQTWSFQVPGPGVSLCEATVLRESFFYDFKVLWMNITGVAASLTPTPTPRSRPVLVWISERDFYPDDNNPLTSLPAVLEWRVNHTTCQPNGRSAACPSRNSSCSPALPDGHTCKCDDGYQGNPYISNGCTDVDECKDPETYPCFGVCENNQGSYQCLCPAGFTGANASVPNRCKDIDECKQPEKYSCYGDCTNMRGTFQCQCKHGTYGDPFKKGGCSSLSVLKIGLAVGSGTVFLLLAIGAPFTARTIKQHKVKRTKERFFKQNHGLLLQQLESQKSDIGGRMIITLQEIDRATNNFDPSHEIGGGGHGTVYKGLLDLQVVAIKKSKIIVQREIDDFINEVAILSQINHRNIVKLLGCCLETEVPLLVYEFISNGTLAHHLHVEGNISLPWEDRMRIALETSKALAYLHSAASTPVFHRDIKSSNILLDDSLTAKVSDFGASRYISIDQTGVTTAIQGTIGYLDPMYYYTSRLTDKSDVFSFGVLLIELLTRKRPTVRTSDGEGLVSHFASLITEGDLVGIIDPQIMEEAEVGKVEEVAKLAAMCTKLDGEGRPKMREVEMTLENLRITKNHTRHNMAAERYENGRNVAHSISEGLNMEASRQYTMEEEILLSNTYPR